MSEPPAQASPNAPPDAPRPGVRSVFSEHDGQYRGTFLECGQAGGRTKEGCPCALPVLPGADRCWLHVDPGHPGAQRELGPVGLRLVAELLSAGATQAEAAPRVGLTQGQLSRLLARPPLGDVARRRWWSRRVTHPTAAPARRGPPVWEAHAKGPAGWRLLSRAPAETSEPLLTRRATDYPGPGERLDHLLCRATELVDAGLLHPRALLDYGPLRSAAEAASMRPPTLAFLLSALCAEPTRHGLPWLHQLAEALAGPPAPGGDAGALLAVLSPREREVLLRRFPDPECRGPETYRRLGERMGVSAGRARQISLGALRKVRRAYRLTPLPGLRSAVLFAPQTGGPAPGEAGERYLRLAMRLAGLLARDLRAPTPAP